MIQNVCASGVVLQRLYLIELLIMDKFDDSSNETDTITSGTSKEHKTLIALRKDIEDYETLALAA